MIGNSSDMWLYVNYCVVYRLEVVRRIGGETKDSRCGILRVGLTKLHLRR